MQPDIMHDGDGDTSANHRRPILVAATDKRRRMFCQQDNVRGTSRLRPVRKGTGPSTLWTNGSSTCWSALINF